MQGYNRSLAAVGRLAGISKISVQTGTSHGGVVLPDGSIADVKLDLQALAALSQVAREEYGLAGAVQHGASTLPSNAFGNFPRIETAEIHLATNFQNIVFDHPRLPADLRERIRRVAGRERGERAEDRRHQRAVLLQGPEEGDRPVQAGALVAAGGRPRRHRGRSGEDVRLPVRAAQRERHRGSYQPLRPGPDPASRGAQAGAGGGGRRPRGRGIERGACVSKRAGKWSTSSGAGFLRQVAVLGRRARRRAGAAVRAAQRRGDPPRPAAAALEAARDDRGEVRRAGRAVRRGRGKRSARWRTTTSRTMTCSSPARRPPGEAGRRGPRPARSWSAGWPRRGPGGGSPETSRSRSPDAASGPAGGIARPPASSAGPCRPPTKQRPFPGQRAHLRRAARGDPVHPAAAGRADPPGPGDRTSNSTVDAAALFHRFFPPHVSTPGQDPFGAIEQLLAGSPGTGARSRCTPCRRSSGSAPGSSPGSAPRSTRSTTSRRGRRPTGTFCSTMLFAKLRDAGMVHRHGDPVPREHAAHDRAVAAPEPAARPGCPSWPSSCLRWVVCSASCWRSRSRSRSST